MESTIFRLFENGGKVVFQLDSMPPATVVPVSAANGQSALTLAAPSSAPANAVGGATSGRRKKPCLSARERNVRRIESNERERLRMHGLNEAFQVRSKCACANEAAIVVGAIMITAIMYADETTALLKAAKKGKKARGDWRCSCFYDAQGTECGGIIK